MVVDGKPWTLVREVYEQLEYNKKTVHVINVPDMCTPVNSPKDAEKQSFYQRAGDDKLLIPG